MNTITHFSAIKLLVISIYCLVALSTNAQSQKEQEQRQREATQRLIEAENRLRAERERQAAEGRKRVADYQSEKEANRERQKNDRYTYDPNAHANQVAQQWKNAQEYYNKGLYSQAREEISKFQYSGYGTSEEKAIITNLVGMSYLKEKNYRQAASSFESALEKNPRNAVILSNLGEAYNELSLYNKAEDKLTEAITYDSTLAIAWRLLSVTYRELGYYIDALRVAQKAIALGATSDKAYLNLGKALTALGRFDEAIEALNKSFHLAASIGNSEDVALALSETWIYLHNYQLAQQHATSGLRNNPRKPERFQEIINATTHFIQGDELLAAKRTDEAIEAYKKGTSFFSFKEMHYQLATMLVDKPANAFEHILKLYSYKDKRAENLHRKAIKNASLITAPGLGNTLWERPVVAGQSPIIYSFYSDGTFSFPDYTGKIIHGRWKQTGALVEAIYSMVYYSEGPVDTMVFSGAINDDKIAAGLASYKTFMGINKAYNLILQKTNRTVTQAGSSDKSFPYFDGITALFENEKKIRLSLQAKEENQKEIETIFTAIRIGDLKKIEDYLKQGKYVDVLDNNGGTLLHLAGILDNKDAVALLLAAGADPNIINKSPYQPTPLFAIPLNPVIVKMLLDHGADITVKDILGRTALDIALKIQTTYPTFNTPQHQESIRLLKAKNKN